MDLANHQKNGEYISLKIISERLGISFKYLEKIANMLNKNKYVTVSRGKQGGYKLAKPVEEYNIRRNTKTNRKKYGTIRLCNESRGLSK